MLGFAWQLTQKSLVVVSEVWYCFFFHHSFDEFYMNFVWSNIVCFDYLLHKVDFIFWEIHANITWEYCPVYHMVTLPCHTYVINSPISLPPETPNLLGCHGYYWVGPRFHVISRFSIFVFISVPVLNLNGIVKSCWGFIFFMNQSKPFQSGKTGKTKKNGRKWQTTLSHLQL